MKERLQASLAAALLPYAKEDEVIARITRYDFSSHAGCLLKFLSILSCPCGQHRRMHRKTCFRTGSSQSAFVDKLSRHMFRRQRKHQRPGTGPLNLLPDIEFVVRKLPAEFR